MTDLQPPLAPMAPPNLPAYFFGMIMVCWGVSYATDDPLLEAALCGAMGALLAAQVLSAALLHMHTRRARRRWLAEVKAQADWLDETAHTLQHANAASAELKTELLVNLSRDLNRYGNKN